MTEFVHIPVPTVMKLHL